MHGIHERIDAASLGFFRVAFGLLVAGTLLRDLLDGRVHEWFVAPTFHFTYLGFAWVHPLPAPAMHGLCVVLALAALALAAGILHRLAAATLSVGLAYLLLCEQARYLDQSYLVCLLSCLLVFLPRGPRVPACYLWLLRAQIGLVWIFAGIARLDADWLAGESLRGWLAGHGRLPLVGGWIADAWAVRLASWGSCAFDLLVVPLLLGRRTRALGLVIAIAFHLATAALFRLGAFPWLMIAGATLFLDPSWPRVLFVGSALPPEPAAHRARSAILLAALWLLVQVVVPLRHYLYPGRVSWTEEGQRFAWRMMARSKNATTTFVVRQPGEQRLIHVDPADELMDWQRSRIVARPDMILQYAHHLAQRFQAHGGGDVEVRALSRATLNGRARQDLVDPTVDLAKEPRHLRTARWIVPLDSPGSERPRAR